ncbi:MAG: nucleotide sugar dehydrogenase [Acidimicrobiia bacterium]
MTPTHLTNFHARIDGRTARIAVVGLGYVGLPLAMRAAELGFEVVGYDTATARVESLRNGVSYVEDVADSRLRAALETGFRPTDDPADLHAFDTAVVTVQTPLRDGAPDLSHIETAARELGRHLQPGALVVLESTTYPGTTEELFQPILEQSGLAAGRDFFLGYSPERIDPGNAQWNLVNTPKVVSGIDEASTRATECFYGALVDKVVPVGCTAEAELVKLLENTFRHVNIALMNELAIFAHHLGVDIWSAIGAANTKPFGYTAFYPGPGVGGHCLPIDPMYLAWRVERRLDQSFRFVELANDVNRHMPDYVVSRIGALLNRDCQAVNGARILLLGLAYKGGTSDWRESPACKVAGQLADLGAELRICDSHVAEDAKLGIAGPRVDCTVEELEEADLVVILTDHPDLPYDDIALHSHLVLDTRGVLHDRAFRGEVL